MNRKILSSKSTIFYKFYWVNLLITAVFVGLVSVICGLVSVRFLLKNIVSFNEDMMTEKANTMDERIQQIQNTVNLIAEEENVFRLMMSDEQDCEKPMELLHTIQYFQSICSNNSMISGVCLVDTGRELAITERTKLPLQDVRDYSERENQSFFLEECEGEEEEGKKQWELKYLTRFQPVQSEKTNFIILTIDKNIFTNDLLNESSLLNTYLVTADEKTLKAEDTIEMPETIREVVIPLNERKITEPDDKEDVIIYSRASQLSDLRLAAYSDHSHLLKETEDLVKRIIVVSILAVLVASVIIYRCSLYTYKPLKQLGTKISGLVAPSNKTQAAPDEYNLIETAVNALQNEKENMMPAVIRDMLRKLLTDEFDQKFFDRLKEKSGQRMEYDRNVIVITESECPHSGEIITRRFGEMIGAVNEISGFFTEVTAARCVGVFSTSFEYNQFLIQISSIKKLLENEGVLMTCCVSREFMNWENLRSVYSETLRNLERKFFIGKNTLIYDDTPVETFSNEYYSREAGKRLVNYVTEGNNEAALETLHDLTRELRSTAGDIQYTRFVYVQIFNNLMRNVVELGGRLPKEYNEKEVFNKMFKAESIQELETIAEKMLYVCLSNFGRRNSAYSQNVEKVIGFLKEKYMMDLSLDDVAGAVFLSSGYLSIIFKEETGYTVMEYLTKIRMKKAKELVLQTPALKIKDISEQLGYNNVQSFIRYFKKHYGESPAAYRKRMEVQ